MKKIRVLICGFIVVLGGFALVACNEETETPLDFDTAKIQIEETSAIYDGNTHSIVVSYQDNVDITVEYSLDNQTFGSAEDLLITEAGNYDIYYKISARGYNDYISEDAHTLIVSRAEITLTLKDAYRNLRLEEVDFSYSVEGEYVEGDDLQINFINNIEEESNISAGEEYTLSATVGNQNYDVIVVDAKYHIVDNIVIERDNLGTMEYYYFETMEQALSLGAIENYDEIKLYNNIQIDTPYNFNNTELTFNGQEKYTISPSEAFMEFDDETDGKYEYMFRLIQSPKIILKNITIDAQGFCRVIIAEGTSILVLNNAIIKGGYISELIGETSEYNRAAGIYITGSATLIMESGRIEGNVIENAETRYIVEDKKEYYYTYFSQDLWVGSEATAIIYNGSIDKAYIDANQSSEGTTGGIISVDGGGIGNLYLEYNDSEGVAAKLVFESGFINNLYISRNEGNGAYYILTEPELNTYIAGQQ